MQRGAGQMVPVGVFGQLVYIGAVDLSFIVQAKAVGNHYLALPDGRGHFQFNCHPAGLGRNAYHVVTAKGVSVTALLDGFIITAGQGNQAPGPVFLFP